MSNYIQIEGARTNNLKSISVKIRQQSITCLVGPSGSGKSSLAVSTLYTEAKRRFINSLSTDQKFFWDIPQACDVDLIDPVMPSWYLPQSNPLMSSRTNLSDLLGITADLAKLFAESSTPYCHEHQCYFVSEDLSYILTHILQNSAEISSLHFLAERANVATQMIYARSYDQLNRVIRDNCEEDSLVEIWRTKKRDVKYIVERLQEFKDFHLSLFIKGPDKLISLSIANKWICPIGGERIDILDSFQYFNPLLSFGACPECKGMGDSLEYDRRKIIVNRRKSLKEQGCALLQFKRFRRYEEAFWEFCKREKISLDQAWQDVDNVEVWNKLEQGDREFVGLKKIYAILEKKKYKKPYRIFARKFKSEFECPQCRGTRLNRDLFNYILRDTKHVICYEDVLSFNLEKLFKVLSSLPNTLILDVILSRLETAINLGLGHLSLKSNGKYLTTSEYQRALLVKYLSYEGSGSLFILDEPSIGLNLEEQQVLQKYLRELVRAGNTVLLIDHSEYLQKEADEIIELGPKAGLAGGEICYQGKAIVNKSRELWKQLTIKKRKKRGKLVWKGVEWNGFQKEMFVLPLGCFTVVRGSSSSGKSTFFNHVVANELSLKLYGELLSYRNYHCQEFVLEGKLDHFVLFSYAARSYSARSTIGTLLGLTGLVRKYYAHLPEAKNLNLKEGHFSANSELGRCEGCQGRGVQVVEMDILEDVVFTCPDCLGKKVKPIYADISDGVQTFYQAISSDMETILSRIDLTPKFQKIYNYVKKLRLEYLSLDRSFNTLSGGEKQRILLLLHILKQEKDTLYLFENLSAGLSAIDFLHVVTFLEELVEKGNSVVLLDESTLFDSLSVDHFFLNFD